MRPNADMRGGIGGVGIGAQGPSFDGATTLLSEPYDIVTGR